MRAFRLVGRILSRYGGPAGYYTTTSALAVLFLFPLVWSGWSSVKEQPLSPQDSGYGFASYTALLHTARAWEPTPSTARSCRC